jgi:hypothetical protein
MHLNHIQLNQLLPVTDTEAGIIMESYKHSAKIFVCPNEKVLMLIKK